MMATALAIANFTPVLCFGTSVPMRVAQFILSILICVTAAFANEIREFNLPTLEKLGNELSHRDEIAAKASDLVFEKHPEFKKVTPQGWITDLHPDGDVVYFIVEANDAIAPAYKVMFPREGSPQVEDIHSQSLPRAIATRYRARQTAMRSTLPRLNDAYGAHYNFEVLDDPDGSGFLVYGLAAFRTGDAVYTGGHMRVTVSADGSKTERVDELSHGIIQQKADPGKEMVAVSTSQAVDTKYPVETWLYTSHLYHLPMYVAAKNGSVWACVNGRIVRVDDQGPKNHVDIMNLKVPNKHDPGGRY
jgi:hypothetical protein